MCETTKRINETLFLSTQAVTGTRGLPYPQFVTQPFKQTKQGNMQETWLFSSRTVPHPMICCRRSTTSKALVRSISSCEGQIFHKTDIRFLATIMSRNPACTYEAARRHHYNTNLYLSNNINLYDMAWYTYAQGEQLDIWYTVL